MLIKLPKTLATHRYHEIILIYSFKVLISAGKQNYEKNTFLTTNKCSIRPKKTLCSKITYNILINCPKLLQHTVIMRLSYFLHLQCLFQPENKIMKKTHF